jgi:hypothetical protein
MIKHRSRSPAVPKILGTISERTETTSTEGAQPISSCLVFFFIMRTQPTSSFSRPKMEGGSVVTYLLCPLVCNEPVSHYS